MTEDAMTKIVNKKQFLSLLKDADQKKTRVASINGELGERIKNAVENGHLHRQLFGLMLKLSRMDEVKRGDFLAQFPIYVEMCREGGIFGQEHVGDIDELARKAEQDERDADAAQAEANGKAVMDGIKPLSQEDREFDDGASEKPSRRRKSGGVGDEPGNYKLH